ncbi:M15 family metallopeptidase [Acinetobacter boissieri]|uniref:Peptidoglycan L-alanyl-D-glutamate endopeptidase CwlK n=1 Tax=Acinetobacter boissieri TaxID=1219383 RepID=A0A1G6IKM8_9GAMM|nr:M15 family metallopeptidase [Acinetobacter boissieri]SDC06555.1 peptidoglycan L-alanyl-D-glutamate endopeptidase CwlK [Acinetobacter boissieri]
MIVFVICSFLILAVVLSLFSSHELRVKTQSFFYSIMPRIKKRRMSICNFSKKMNYAMSSQQTQKHWYLQQWGILITGFFLLGSIVVFSLTRTIDPTRIEANYLKEVDPQIYTLLNGEMLNPPSEVDEKLVDEAIVQAMRLEQEYRVNHQNPKNSLIVDDVHGGFDTKMVDRKWENMNPRYKQRLLMVFKIMRDRYDYELVLLEGYRSPDRQNLLSGDTNTTRAKAYQSYHQFGLAADIAFKRNGKVIISERDPWAWRGYQLYGEVAESVGLTWGGRWTSIKDYGHTEYRMPGLKKTKETAESLILEGAAKM